MSNLYKEEEREGDHGRPAVPPLLGEDWCCSFWPFDERIGMFKKKNKNNNNNREQGFTRIKLLMEREREKW
mgnify:CR=1 FL=1